MYKTSNDLRFRKNQAALQRAYIDLVLEKKTANLTVKEIADRANVNRMTFYSHYDTAADILREFVDAMTEEIIAEQSNASGSEFDLKALLDRSTQLMQREIEFFRLVAKDDDFGFCRSQFRDAFKTIFRAELEKNPRAAKSDQLVMADFLASGVTYVYLDWLAGEYGELPLEGLLNFLNDALRRFF